MSIIEHVVLGSSVKEIPSKYGESKPLLDFCAEDAFHHEGGVWIVSASPIGTRLLFIGLICQLALMLWTLPGRAETPKAVIETKFGNMEVEFFPQKAPKHVENFIKLAKSGFYDGTIFHRVIPGFMIQGGDPHTKETDKSKYGMGGPGYNIKAEFNDIPHTRGIVSMARSQHPDSAGSQFFIMVTTATHLDGQYTAFGKVVKGMEVADKIVAQKRDSKDNPQERIEMKVKVIEAEKK